MRSIGHDEETSAAIKVVKDWAGSMLQPVQPGLNSIAEQIVSLQPGWMKSKINRAMVEMTTPMILLPSSVVDGFCLVQSMFCAFLRLPLIVRILASKT